MPTQPPLMTPDQFIGESMASKTRAGLTLFLKLWQSSESLKLLIKQVVLNSNLEQNEGNSISKIATLPGGEKVESIAQNHSLRSLIEKGAISPPKIEDQYQQSYGGISRKELLVLLEKYKAGKRNMGTYMLVRAWKKYTANTQKPPDFRLEQCTVNYFKRAIRENRADFFNEIADTIGFLEKEEYKERGEWKHDPGQWWQFHLLLYVLENPKNAYAMREFVKYFQDEVGTNEMPTTKTIRSFCRSRGIALDSRPGAPRKPKPK